MMDATEKLAIWRKYLGTAVQVVVDFKVLGLLVLNVLLVYMGTWDTVMRPNLEQMKGRDDALAEQKKALEEKQGLQKRYSSMEQQLRSLDTELIAVPDGNSAKVVAVTEAAEILDLAKGNQRDTKVLPLLLPPHDRRSDVSLTATTEGKLDLLNPDNTALTADGNNAQPNAVPTQGPPHAMMPGGESRLDKGPDRGQPLQMGSTSLPVERFDYELKVSGTYPALMDVLNELVIRHKLIKINKVVISRPANADVQPDAKENPDFPVRLEMVVSLSMLLFSPNAPSS